MLMELASCFDILYYKNKYILNYEILKCSCNVFITLKKNEHKKCIYDSENSVMKLNGHCMET